jgi:hypothetical protein
MVVSSDADKEPVAPAKQSASAGNVNRGNVAAA